MWMVIETHSLPRAQLAGHRPPPNPQPGEPGYLEPTSSFEKWGTKVPKSDLQCPAGVSLATPTRPRSPDGLPKGDPTWPVCKSRLLDPLKIGNTWSFKDQQPDLLPTSAQNPA